MRELIDAGGHRWGAEIISHGRTSGYLNPRVHRPIVQFSCLDARRPKRYGRLPGGTRSLDDLSGDEMETLFARAKTH